VVDQTEVCGDTEAGFLQSRSKGIEGTGSKKISSLDQVLSCMTRISRGQSFSTEELEKEAQIMKWCGLLDHIGATEKIERERERERESFLLQCSHCLRCFSATKGRVKWLMMFLGRGCSWWPPGKEETVGASDNARQIKDWECRRKEGAFMFVAWCTARHGFCNSSGLVSITCRNWSSTSWSGAKSENSSKSSQLQP
jgi:hypothetical protein